MPPGRHRFPLLRLWWWIGLSLIAVPAIGLALFFALISKSNGVRLHSFDGKPTFATAINDHGEIFGCYLGDDNKTHNIAWDAHGKIHPSEQRFRFPLYNTAHTPPENDHTFTITCAHGARFNISEISDRKDPLFIEDIFLHARDRNHSGQIVGITLTYNYGRPHAAFFDSTIGAVDLDTLGGETSEAFAVNEASQVVGQAQTPAGENHAFLWEIPSSLYLEKSFAAKWDVPVLQDLGTLGGKESAAYGLNNFGQVVGASETATGQIHAFLWDTENGMQDLHPFLAGKTSVATDINDHGQIVGFAESDSGNMRAFCWSPHDGLIWLDDFGAKDSFAARINNHGQIIGLIEFPPPWRIRAWNWLAEKIPLLHDHTISPYSHTRTEPVLWTIPPPATNTPRAASENLKSEVQNLK